MNRRGPSTALVLASACLGLAACGSGGKTAAIPSSSPATSASTATTSTTTSTTSTTPKPKLGKPTAAVKALAAAAGTNTKKKPKIGKPKGKPPTALIEDDIVKGKGPPAKDGQTLSVDYVGASWSTGKEFDASWTRHQPFSVSPLGQAQVIDGWNQGLAGMRKGGRRLLVIPPGLGYGASGRPPIAPNETLIFVVDLRKLS